MCVSHSALLHRTFGQISPQFFFWQMSATVTHPKQQSSSYPLIGWRAACLNMYMCIVYMYMRASASECAVLCLNGGDSGMVCGCCCWHLSKIGQHLFESWKHCIIRKYSIHGYGLASHSDKHNLKLSACTREKHSGSNGNRRKQNLMIPCKMNAYGALILQNAWEIVGDTFSNVNSTSFSYFHSILCTFVPFLIVPNT